MAEILFKRLFEVRILHGYYLDHWFPNQTGEPGSFHEFKDEPQSSRLAKQAFVLENKYKALSSIGIEPTPDTLRWLSQNKIIWRKTPVGVFAGIQVRRDGTGAATRFFPSMNLPLEGSCSFLLTQNNPEWLNAANHSLQPTLPGYYYFSNLRAAEEGKLYPSLSVQLPEFEAGRTWEMGSLIRNGNLIKAARETTEVESSFDTIANINTGTWHQYAHTKDRLALPKIFKYRFDSFFSVVNLAEFTLTDIDGNVVKTITALNPVGATYSLDFRYLPLKISSSEEERINPRTLPNGWYNLSVRINGALFETYRILLSSDLKESSKSVWGLVEISSGDTASDFRLLNPDGSINVETIAGSDPLRWQGPVFEIRLLSRLTYWRYRIEKLVSPVPADPDFNYQFQDQHFTTARVRKLSQVRVPISINLPSGNTALPSPISASIRYDSALRQYYSEIFLSTF